LERQKEIEREKSKLAVNKYIQTVLPAKQSQFLLQIFDRYPDIYDDTQAMGAVKDIIQNNGFPVIVPVGIVNRYFGDKKIGELGLKGKKFVVYDARTPDKARGFYKDVNGEFKPVDDALKDNGILGPSGPAKDIISKLPEGTTQKEKDFITRYIDDPRAIGMISTANGPKSMTVSELVRYYADALAEHKGKFPSFREAVQILVKKGILFGINKNVYDKLLESYVGQAISGDVLE